MVVLGLLLVLAAIAAGALAVYGLPSADTNQISWNFLGNTLSISPTVIFFIGVAATLALALGLWLMSLGAKASARKRRELKQLRRDQKEHDRERAGREDALQHERTQRAIAEQHSREQSRLVDEDRRDGGASNVTDRR